MSIDKSLYNEINILKGVFPDIAFTKEGACLTYPNVIVLEWKNSLRRMASTFLFETNLKTIDMNYLCFERLVDTKDIKENLKHKPIGDVCKIIADEGICYFYTYQKKDASSTASLCF